MAFGDDFAAALGGSLVSVDPGLFDSAEATAQQLSGFKSFIVGLDQASLASLDAVTGSRSVAGHRRGRRAQPSGRRVFAVVAAAAQQPVEQVASAAQQSRDSVQGTA